MKEIKRFIKTSKEWLEGLFTGLVLFSMIASLYWLYMSLYAIGF